MLPPCAQARHEAPWVFVSSPQYLQDGTDVMGWMQGQCKRQPWRFKQAFDWADSGNSYKDANKSWRGVTLFDSVADAQKWDAVFGGGLTARWGQHVRGGDLGAAAACIRDDIAPLIVATEWYKNFRKQSSRPH